MSVIFKPSTNETIYWKLQDALDAIKKLEKAYIRIGKGIFVVVDETKKAST
jgi:hypothetical protein